jgi:hypothetical protein
MVIIGQELFKRYFVLPVRFGVLVKLTFANKIIRGDKVRPS